MERYKALTPEELSMLEWQLAGPIRQLEQLAGELEASTVAEGKSTGETNRMQWLKSLDWARQINQWSKVVLARTKEWNEKTSNSKEATNQQNHSMRTPLAMILGLSELIYDRAMIPAGTRQEYAKLIGPEASLLTRDINRLVQFYRLASGMEPPKRSTLVLDEAAKEVANRYATPRWPEQTSTYWNRPTEKIRVIDGDATKLTWAIDELVQNAINHVDPANYSIVDVSVGQTQTHATVSVTDHGRGFQLENRRKLFLPFSHAEFKRTEDVRHLGLGLAMVAKIVEQHNGFYFAHSKGAGKGATFGFGIPLQENYIATQKNS